MTGSEYVVRTLERHGVEVVFGHPGGAIIPVYDALVDAGLRHVLVRHEQAAALAADGYARSTGRPGVCLATSGPGATNLVTGLANAHMDSIPVVAITGQVPTDLIGTDAFQEVDVLGITFSVVKHSFLPERPEELPRVMREAFRLAGSGRPGPVLVDLPKDVAQSEVEADPVGPRSGNEGLPAPDEAQVERAAEVLRHSERPLVYGGGGIVLGGLVEEFRAFVEATGIPVVTTLKGLGSVPTSHPRFLGMLGMHGTRAANLAIQECDTLVCIGARFDDRATGKLEEFAPEARVIHMDADPAEVGKLRHAVAPVLGDLAPALRRLSIPLDVGRWRRRCLGRRDARGAETGDENGSGGVDGPAFLRALSEAAGGDASVVCDVGQHQMWVAQHWGIDRPERHLSSGGLGAMGYGLPAAIGAQLARPEATVINVAGDGSFLMNVQELATVTRYGLPVKIVVMDNRALGMVRQWQELFCDARFSAVDLSDNPDFIRLAEAFGVPAFTVEDGDRAPEAIRRLLDADGPILVRVRLDPEDKVWPLVPPGASNAEMLDANTWKRDR